MEKLLPMLALALIGCQDLPTAEVTRPVESPPPTGVTSHCSSGATPPCIPDGSFAAYDPFREAVVFYPVRPDSMEATDTLTYEFARTIDGGRQVLGQVWGPSEVEWRKRSTSNPDGFVSDSIWSYDFQVRAEDQTAGTGNQWSQWSESFQTEYGDPLPTIVTVDSTTTTSIALSWNLATTPTGLNDTYEYLLIGRNITRSQDEREQVNSCDDCTSYLHTGLTSGDTWQYHITIRYGKNSERTTDGYAKSVTVR